MRTDTMIVRLRFCSFCWGAPDPKQPRRDAAMHIRTGLIHRRPRNWFTGRQANRIVCGRADWHDTIDLPRLDPVPWETS